MLMIVDEGGGVVSQKLTRGGDGRVREKLVKWVFKCQKCVKKRHVKPAWFHICFFVTNNQKSFIM